MSKDKGFLSKFIGDTISGAAIGFIIVAIIILIIGLLSQP